MSDSTVSLKGKGLALMSHAEQAFQRFIGDAAELEGRLGLSGSISHQIFYIEDPLLAKLRSSEVGIVSLALSPIVQMGLPDSFPVRTTKRSGLCFTSLPSNKIRSFAPRAAAFDILRVTSSAT